MSGGGDAQFLIGRRQFRRLRAMALSARQALEPERRRTAPVDTAIGFVICGVEHSGTTLVSDLFRQVPGIGSGFETGVLLADTPADFAGVETHFCWFRDSWWLSDDDVGYICAAPDFAAFYDRLAARAGVLRPGTARIFDKTPRYLVALEHCLGRIHVPFIATFKDPRAQLHSDWVRAGRPELMAWLDEVTEQKLGYLLSCYDQYQRHRMERRVLFRSLEELCLRTGPSCEAMFEHVGLRFDPRYLVFQEVPYVNTRGRSVSAGAPFAYMHEWPADSGRVVRDRFAALEDWFYG